MIIIVVFIAQPVRETYVFSNADLSDSDG